MPADEMRRLTQPRVISAGAPIAAALACALLLSACGDTLQDEPIGAAPFEDVLVNSRFPVYWLGLRFDGLETSSVREDPGGAVTIDYGNCLVGGQYTCVTPLQVVTSPDNSFVPSDGAGAQAIAIRGLRAVSSQDGATLTLATGPVVVSIYGRGSSQSTGATLAWDAAQTMTPVNEPGLSQAPLPPPSANTGFDRLPLRSQLPPGQAVPRLSHQITP